MIPIPDISQQRPGISQGSRCESPAQESKDEDASCVGTEGASDLEARIDEEGQKEDWSTAVALTEGTPKERTLIRMSTSLCRVIAIRIASAESDSLHSTQRRTD